MTARWDFWNGPDELDRRVKYAKAFLPEYQANGDDTQRRIGAVETAFRAETQIELPPGYASGWRPAAVNDATANAGKLSNHLVANAGDKRDNVDGAFAWWCMRNTHVLESQGVWLEHPSATVLRAWKLAIAERRDPTPWCHLQRTPPSSHARVYFPDARSGAEWEAFLAAGGVAGMSFEAYKALNGDAPRQRKAAKPSDDTEATDA